LRAAAKHHKTNTKHTCGREDQELVDFQNPKDSEGHQELNEGVLKVGDDQEWQQDGWDGDQVHQTEK